MFTRFFIVSLLTMSIIASSATANTVTFKSMSTAKSGDPVTLRGNLVKPQGEGPFPAVVMLHGCLGMEFYKKYFEIWAERLARWGYVSLQVDSLEPRGESNICGPERTMLVPPPVRAQDAYDAKSYLAGLPFVDQTRIGIMGWSHGGWTILYAIDETTRIQHRGDPFRAAIALYPYCIVPLQGFNAPLLILIGELDDWTRPELCQNRMPSKKMVPEVSLKVYPGAYHCFDFEGLDMYYRNHRLLYNPAATADGIKQVKGFLAKHLK